MASDSSAKNKPETAQKDWRNTRIRPDLDDWLVARVREAQIKGEESVTKVALVNEALERFVRLHDLGQTWESSDPAITPQTKEEKDLVRMILAFLREPQDSVETGLLTLIRNVYGNRR